MTSVYEIYGEGARKKLPDQWDLQSLECDIGWGERDIRDIQQFITEARNQVEVIKQTAFRRFIWFNKGKDCYAKKVEFSVSVYRVPQVPGYEKIKVFEFEDSKRFVGNDKKKEAIAFVREMLLKYRDAELIGNFTDAIKPEKTVLVVP